MPNSNPNISQAARLIQVQFIQRDFICLHSRSYSQKNTTNEMDSEELEYVKLRYPVRAQFLAPCLLNTNFVPIRKTLNHLTAPDVDNMYKLEMGPPLTDI